MSDDSTSYTATLVLHLSKPRRNEVGKLRNLDELLGRLLTSARTTWPNLDVREDVFFQYVAERLTPHGPIEEALEQLHWSDLYLACACTLGAPQAVMAFRDQFLPIIRRAILDKGSEQFVEELCQQVMTMLLTAVQSKKLGILSYAGRSHLGAWLKVVALRTASRLVFQRNREPLCETDLLVNHAIETQDPELQQIKRLYRAQFKRAFQQAFFQLSPRDRNVLRYLYIDLLNIDQVGMLYGVHRATVARWRVAARKLLFEQTRTVMCERLKISDSEFATITDLIKSQLDVSLPRLLALDTALTT